MSNPSPIWPDVQPGAASARYVDREEDERPIGEKIPVYHGEVTTPFTGGSVAFSLVVWTSSGGIFSAGEVLDLFLGYRADPAAPTPAGLATPAPLSSSDAVGGGSKTALSDLPPEAFAQPVVLLERSRAQGKHGETLLTLAGLVSSTVDRLEIRAGGTTRPVPLFVDPLSADHRLFVAFPPLNTEGEATGTLVAFAAGGGESWSGAIRPLLPAHEEGPAGYASMIGGE